MKQPRRLTVPKPETEARDSDFLFGSDLGEMHEEEPEFVGVSRYNADEAVRRLHATIVDYAKPFTHPIPDHGSFVPRPGS